MGDLASFENYCMICDRLIVAPPEPEPAEKKPKKKTGAIRIKNPDGSTTIRTANGVKTTRPQLRRPSSEAPSKVPAERPRQPSTDGSIPVPAAAPAEPSEPPFVSNIYCSRKCAEQDAGASGPAAYENMARMFGLGLTNSSDAILVPGHMGSIITSPPSPLLSDTETGSSAASANANASPASVPALDLFREDVTRHRRTSIAHASRFSITPFEPVVPAPMSRNSTSTSSGRPRSTVSGTSTDSLLSLWQGEPERSYSSSGAQRSGSYRRLSSDTPSTAPRPFLPRAAVSHVSLGTLPSSSASMAGSAPSHAAVLMAGYVSAFPARDGSPSLKPVSGLQTPDFRSSAINSPPAVTIRPRPRTGSAANGSWDAFAMSEVIERTRRSARLGSNASSTDLANGGSSLTREASSPELERWRERADSIGHDATPKQSLEDGGWQIRYTRPSSRSSSRTRSASREPRTAPVPENEPSHATSLARPIPSRPLPSSPATIAGSNSTAHSRTPQVSSRLAASNRSTTAVPDLAALRIGSPCAPVVSTENVSCGDSSRSLPRAGFDWNEACHRTYELPPGVVVNPNKGLFYFNA